VVDVSLYEPLFRLVESQVIGYDQLGIVKARRGNRIEEDSPRNAYATADGEWIAISASSDRTFARLAAAIGRPGLPADPRYRTNADRIANDVELDAIVAAWMVERTAAEVMEQLERCDVVAGRVYTIVDALADPQYRARQTVVSVPDPDFGSVRMPGVVPGLSRTAGTVSWPGGRLGEHTDEVLRELAGLDEAGLAGLRAAGVV
jgi:crotonobetainyl-CoA:carnitine CoA-transferase CaiB-like acyl-CoA transferase